ncbi:MAG: hypothetical protein ABII79_03425 [bacterium]
MRKLLLYIVTVLVIGAVDGRAAKYAGDAFSLGVGGRALALGGAVIAGPFDATTAYWNPAGMNRLKGRYAVFMHAETFGSLLNHDYLSYIDARPDDRSLIRAFGFYLYYLGGGGIKITDTLATGRPFVVREVSHGDYLLAAAISGRIGQSVDFGLTTRIIYRDIGTEKGYGLTVDAGLLYQAHEYFNLGLMVTDITSGFIRYSGQTFDDGANYETIYPTIRPALMAEYTYSDFTGRFLTSGEIKFENLRTASQYWSGSTSLDTHFGWELGYREMAFGRVGFDIGRFTAGGGLDVSSVTIDFAYLHHSALNETYRVSAGYRF